MTPPRDPPLDLPLDLPLDWEAVAGALAGAPAGHRFHFLPTTSSTQDVARGLAGEGAPDGTVVVADEQTAGRGRAGKAPWLTPPRTALAVSVLLRPPLPPDALAGIGMAAGVAAVEALRSEAGIRAGLKWPNDVVARVGNRGSGSGSGSGGSTGAWGKLGGILVETALRGPAVSHAILGIGLNVNLPAAALGGVAGATLPPTTVLDLTGRPASREALLLRLLRELGRLLAPLYAGHPAAVLEPYRAAQTVLGRRVRLTGAGTSEGVEGEAESIGPDGALTLRLADGSRARFAYGEVTLRLPHGPDESEGNPAPLAG